MVNTHMQSASAQEKTAKAAAGGSGAAALCGVGALVLTILGLAGLIPFDFCAIAVIAAGAGLAFQGGAIAARYHDALAATRADERTETELEGGISTEMMGGIAGIVLGILALIHIAAHVLLPVAAIVLGASLLLGSAAEAPLNDMTPVNAADYETRRVTRYAVSSAIGADVLVGLGAITLGILGLIHVAHAATPILTLVALLAVGAAELVNGSALGARMSLMFRH